MTILEIYKRHNTGWQRLEKKSVNDLDEWRKVIAECCKKFNVNENELLITPHHILDNKQKAN